jgi:KaiC/GvpD/RAD55 family RecA-like ATPase
VKPDKLNELEQAAALISSAFSNGRIDALELAARMDEIGRAARDACESLDGFRPSPERVEGELEARVEMSSRELQYHQAFLDDVLRCIAAHDLILVGADTGVGKTDFVTGVARENARRGKRVFYFALEAEPQEIERRIKFSILCEQVDRHGSAVAQDLNYADWYRGKCEHIVGRFNADADALIAKKLATLHTYYRGSRFGFDELRKLFLAIQDRADMVIVDHLQYLELPDDAPENVAYKRAVSMIRDLVLGAGKPVILVAHLRKRDVRARRIVPDIEDFHGSSDIIKICTRAIMLAPARSMPSGHPMTANTFIHVPKDRIGGATGLVALQEFHRGLRAYSTRYRLGRPSSNGQEWEELERDLVPRWAKGCKQ